MTRVGSLFTGYGGLDRAVTSVLGGSTAWVSDVDKGADMILEHRYPGVPNLGDVTSVDWADVEPVDVLTGGFPCQDVSVSGRRAGMRPGTRSGLWSHMAYAIGCLRPGVVVIENVKGLLSADADSDVESCPWCVGERARVPLRALGAVLGDLAELGYDAAWHGIRASDVGAPHERFRIFIVAAPYTGRVRREPRRSSDPGETSGRGALRHARRRVLVPTPVARDWKGTSASDEARRSPALSAVEALLPGAGTELNRWGIYADAIAQWEQLTRPAPAPTQPSRTGARQLSARFSEWLMGLPDGFVTDVPGLTRAQALRAIGNGVCPQQAEAGLRILAPLAGLEVVA